MGAMSPAAAALKAELEAALMAEAERLGPDGFDRAAVVQKFMDRGIGRSTIFRWAKEITASGRLGRHVAKVVKEAAAKRAETSPDPARSAAEEVGAKLPATVTMSDVMPSGSALDIVERLKQCITTALNR
jgi:hypothetical protein